MSYIVALLFLLGTLLPISGYSDTSPWWTHFTYMFAHQNFFHLLVNTVSFFTVAKLLQQVFNKWFLLMMSVLIAFTMSFYASYPIETVGGSGMVYTLIGMFSGLVAMGKIKFKSVSLVFLFIFGISLGFFVSYIKDGSNTLLHLLCFLGGFVVGFLEELKLNKG